MSSRSRTSLITKLLRNKQYRDAYVAEHVRNGVPFQIRTMRDQREWTQSRLGQEAGKPQNVISRLEDPNYGKVTIQTLLEIASALDVALIVKFVPFSRLLKEYENVSPDALAVSSIQDEAPQLEAWASENASSLVAHSVRDATTAIGEIFNSRNTATHQQLFGIEGKGKSSVATSAQRPLFLRLVPQPDKHSEETTNADIAEIDTPQSLIGGYQIKAVI